MQVERKQAKPKGENEHYGMITPPIDDGYWILRCKVSDSQAVVAFPKFGGIGIGFQNEEDWNTNLPFNTDPVEIFNHIKCNKGDDAIPDKRCIAAIISVQLEMARIVRETLCGEP